MKGLDSGKMMKGMADMNDRTIPSESGWHG